MARITVLGGTGYAGSNIVAVAKDRGHEVVAYSRNAPKAPLAGVDYRQGDLTDAEVLAEAVGGTDVVVSALSPRGDLAEPGKLRNIEKRVAELAAANGVRFGVVGGAGSLLVAPDGPALFTTPDFPADYLAEAEELAGVLDDLRSAPEDLDWFYVSPAAGFGALAPGAATGKYRVGIDVLLVDANGVSDISGADFALAVVDEIEKPQHRRSRFTVAY